ncbi:MAG: hypothetical protein V4506_04135, partial [Bacteroidota bacterium]
MRLNIKFLIIVFFAGTFLCACNGDKNEESNDLEEENTDTGLDSQKISAQNVFNALPARDKIITITTTAGAEYNPMLLNDPNAVNKYSTESSKALNLGVYGADLNVTGVFEQTQESMLFLKCVNILAKNLGVSNSFDEKMIDRMEANKSNRDSTLEIVSQSFKSADKYLKDNGRPGTSSLIVAGAWVEGIYLAIGTAKETKNEIIVKEIYAQGESLKYLIQLLEQSKISEDANY